jgi:hypothetical protein
LARGPDFLEQIIAALGKMAVAMDPGPCDMRVRVHEHVQFGLLRQVIQEGDGVDTGDSEWMCGDLGDPLTAGIDFEVPTDKALSILVTRLNEHAQPPWRCL